MIKPTVGRVVWFWPNGVPTTAVDAQPHAALIVHVWGDEMVNLAVFDQNGVTYSKTSAELHQGEEAERPKHPHASWMPYQVGQAKKHTEGNTVSQDQTNACQPAPFDNRKPERPTVERLESILGCSGDSPAPPAIKVAISASAADCLRCLFFHGPTWDGNVPSKSGRDELVDMKLAARGDGWQWLTRAGIDACLANGIHVEKERRESREAQRRYRITEAAREILGD